MPLKLEFVTHAAFFSAETKQPKVLDPQVFVEDSAAPEASGPQGIKHVAGIRPPFIDQDPKTSKLFNSRAQAAGFRSPTAPGRRTASPRRPDGATSVTVTLPSMPTHDNAVLFIYNSGGQPHGMDRDRIGVDAHHQIIARPEPISLSRPGP